MTWRLLLLLGCVVAIVATLVLIAHLPCPPGSPAVRIGVLMLAGCRPIEEPRP